MRLAIEHSTASRSVETAQRDGLVRKTPSADDLRRTHVELTTHGQSVLKQASERRRELLETVTEGWTQGNLSLLINLLESLRAGFDELEQDS